jgi:nanoRNase/pAp phosphatase (c-di-AMP/oligoRNAs hydrolase)
MVFQARPTHAPAAPVRTSNTNIGALMLEYGGGGHENAGTCQVDNEMAEDVLGALINRINKDG